MKSVLLLGSGALKIGEAGEFDYSGTQAIKALKEEGVRVILVNPNVATIQTSEGLADVVYFLPVTPEFVEKVIAKEKPDGILLSFGGQTALNCGLTLHSLGILKKYNVEILGTPIAAVESTEDREKFSLRLKELGLKIALGKIVTTVAEGQSYANKLGFPVMVRAGFALGGTGSGIAKTKKELEHILTRAFATTTQVIVEECLYGWKEIEYEVVRDSANNCITVCNMENMDPVGIHTGESIVVAPSQTLTNDEYFKLRDASMAVIRDLQIVGECNIQFALDPKSSDVRVIEVNARLSRSSALASKATGYPLAYIAAKLALGKTLPELKNKVTGSTSAFFEPALDYLVVKMPKWDLDKYTNVNLNIGSEMKSVGEVMAIGRSFPEAIQKAARMIGSSKHGVIGKAKTRNKSEVLAGLKNPTTNRLFDLVECLGTGVGVADLQEETKIDPWFLNHLADIVTVAGEVRRAHSLDAVLLLKAKQHGFSDRQLGELIGTDEDRVRNLRKKQGILPFIKRIDTMSGEFPAITNYLYLTYNADASDHDPNPKEDKVIVLGSGPYAIGTSVEFDWCAVNASIVIRQSGRKSIMVNCNPETVSTDYDMSDYLYFEELTLERVRDIVDIEKSPVVVSVGGQIPNNLALRLAKYKIELLGTEARYINKAEDRREFSTLLDSLNIVQPAWGEAKSLRDAQQLANSLGYPVLLRPSFVLSGKAMSVIATESELLAYMRSYPMSLKEHPLVMTRFLSGAKECDMDGVADAGKLITYAISEHVEGGGVHSGDSTLMLPPQTISLETQREIISITKFIIKALHVHGFFNIQFLITDDYIAVIECNLRASRSVPFVSKTTGTNFARLATEIMLGKSVNEVSIKSFKYVAVKVPQFSYHKLRGADPVQHVEMNSTGEVCGFGNTKEEAYLAAILATGVKYPSKKSAFISLGGMKGKLDFLASVRKLATLEYDLYATSGTRLFLKEMDIESTAVGKMYEGIGRNIEDLLIEHKIDFAVIIPESWGDRDPEILIKTLTDGYKARRLAIDLGIPVFSNTETAAFFVNAVAKISISDIPIQSWQEFLKKF